MPIWAIIPPLARQLCFELGNIKKMDKKMDKMPQNVQKVFDIWINSINMQNDFKSCSYSMLATNTNTPKGSIGRWAKQYNWAEAKEAKLKALMLNRDSSSPSQIPLDEDSKKDVVTLAINQKLTRESYRVLAKFVAKVLSQSSPKTSDIKLVADIAKLTSDRDDRFRDGLLASEKSFDELLSDTVDVEVEG